MKDQGKPVLIPTLSYDAIKWYAKEHHITIKETMKKLLLVWTMNFWSDPEQYGCKLHNSDD